MFASERRTGRRCVSGVSLIELMVGLVVAMLVTLAATGMAIKFMATQRQALGLGSGLANAATALDTVKARLAPAGLGFFGDSSFRCNLLNFSNGATKVSDGASFSPVRIARPSSGWFDTVEVVYGTNAFGGANVLVDSASASGVVLSSYLPASEGQAVLLSPAAAGAACTMRTVTSVTDSTANSGQALAFAESGGNSTYNQGTFATPANYANDDRVAVLGALSWLRFRVSASGNLEQYNVLDGSIATLARGVVAFRVQYGVSSAAGQTTIADWVDPTGAWASIDSANIVRIRALRLQLMVRGTQREKPNSATGSCDATPTAPTLLTGETFDLGSDGQCYRYRLVSAVVPLRNILVGLQ